MLKEIYRKYKQKKKWKKIEKEIRLGKMSINEARKRNGLPPIKSGEIYMVKAKCVMGGMQDILNEESKEEKIMYLCDGEKQDCRKTLCYKKGGECHYTSDVEHARSFKKEKNGHDYVEKEEIKLFEDKEAGLHLYQREQ